MDFDFFKGWDVEGSIKIGRPLIMKVVKSKALASIDPQDDIFPKGHDDAGNKIERYKLADIRYLFAKEICEILMGECHKAIKAPPKKNKNGNQQVLVKLLSYILNDKISHFSIG